MNGFQLADRASPNHAARPRWAPIDMLVLHYTGMRTASAALDRLCDPGAGVSAHYLVEEDGAIWRLVPEHRRAFHAGVSHWHGESDLNSVSLGVEIVNPGHEWGYRAFPGAQMAALEVLCRDLLTRHPIPPHRVVGHSDIAPERKSDPGELFDWARLARAGIGIWPPATAPAQDFVVDAAQALDDLASIGYRVSAQSQTLALAAFQRRFRQSCCDGRLDAETAARLLQVKSAFAKSRARQKNGPQSSRFKTSSSP